MERKIFLAILMIVCIIVVLTTYYSQLQHTSGREVKTTTITTPPWLNILEGKMVISNRTFVYTINTTPDHAIELTKQGFHEYNTSFIYWPQYPGLKIATIAVDKGDIILVIVNGTGFDEKILGLVVLKADVKVPVCEAAIQPSKGLAGYASCTVNYTGYVDIYMRGYIHSVSDKIVFKIMVLRCRT